MARLVLVHGAFRGGWAWDRVRPELEAAGHDVVTPTLTAEGDVTLDVWAAELAVVLSQGSDPAVLVGHSQGGVVALAAAARVPELVRHLVLLDSPVPEPGETAADVLPEAVRTAYGDPPRSAWVEAIPTGDPWVDARLVAAPVAPAYDPVDPDGTAARIGTTYVFCARTPDGVPATYSRQRFDAQARPYVLLDADHDAPLLQPDAVSGLLHQVTARLA